MDFWQPRFSLWRETSPNHAQDRGSCANNFNHVDGLQSKTGPSQGHTLALTGLFVPSSLSTAVELVIRRRRGGGGERESSFIDNLLVRIHLIIVMISVDRPCAMGV